MATVLCTAGPAQFNPLSSCLPSRTKARERAKRKEQKTRKAKKHHPDCNGSASFSLILFLFVCRFSLSSLRWKCYDSGAGFYGMENGHNTGILPARHPLLFESILSPKSGLGQGHFLPIWRSGGEKKERTLVIHAVFRFCTQRGSSTYTRSTHTHTIKLSGVVLAVNKNRNRKASAFAKHRKEIRKGSREGK